MSRCCSTRWPERPALRLLLVHDDTEREFEYIDGAEASLERADARDGRWWAFLERGERMPEEGLEPPTRGL